MSLHLLFIEHTLTSAQLMKRELVGLGVDGEVGRGAWVGEVAG